MAGTTGLEPAASAVTGQRSNQLNYVPTLQINEMRNRQCLCGIARAAYCAPTALGCSKRPYYWLNHLQTAYKVQRRSLRRASLFVLTARNKGTSLKHINSFPFGTKASRANPRLCS